MGISGWAVLHGELWQRSGNSPEKAAYLTGTVFLCSVIYLACSYLLKNEEMGYVYQTLKKKLGRKSEGV
jgi:hypothetical protein